MSFSELLFGTENSATLQECVYPRTAVSATETSSELCLPRAGLKGCFCPASSFARGVALFATNDGIYRFFKGGLSSQIRGGDPRGSLTRLSPHLPIYSAR